MNWDDLKYFLAVARGGSISEGAKILSVQHSTLSRRIRSLERQMGTQLIERKKSGYKLTSAGMTLQKAALKMEYELLKVDGSIAGKDSLLSGKLRITTFNSLASTILMPMFAGFSKKHPGIELHLKVSNIPAKLSEREADVALRLTNNPLETLIGKRLATVASAAYGSQKYLEGLRGNESAAVWLGADCCVFHRTWTQQAWAGNEYHFFSDDALLTQSALRHDLGVAYLACFMGDSDPALERFSSPDEDMNLGLWLLFHPDLKKNAKVLAFRDHMVKETHMKRALFEGSTMGHTGLSVSQGDLP